MTTDFGGTIGRRDVAMQADGKIVVAGVDRSTAPGDFALARYNPDGSLDTTFDGDGRVSPTSAVGDDALGVAVQADGKIVVAGSAAPSSTLPTSPSRATTPTAPSTRASTATAR